METINKEINIYGGKKAIVSKTKYSKQFEIANTVTPELDIDDNLNQYDLFKQVFADSTTNITPANYLNGYKNIIKYFFNSINESVYTKSAQQLGLSVSGAKLFQNTEFQNLIDVQKIKEEIYKDIEENPCIILDPEASEENHPLKNKMIKESFMLLMQTHIIDIKLRNILLTSVFDNKSFYENDNTFVEFCFQSFIDRVLNYKNYYDSISLFLYEEFTKSIENGEQLIDLITNKEIIYSLKEDDESVSEDSKNYIKYLFSNEFIKVSDSFNSCFNRTIKQNGNEVKLSNFLNPKQYFFDQCFKNILITVNNIQDQTYSFTNIPVDTFFITINLKTAIFTGGENIATIALSYKVNNNNSVTASITRLQNINNRTDIVNQLEQILLNFRQQIINDNKINILFNYCFNLNKALNFCSIANTLIVSKNYSNSNINFEPCFQNAKSTHVSMVGNEEQVECETIDASLSLGINAEIAKLIAQTPLNIIKSLEETFDPNIALASKMKKAAEAVGGPDVSIIPYSAYLLFPPPFGPAIPIVPPWGFVYWGISAAETAYNISENGFGGSSFGTLGLDVSGSFDIKNPFNPKC